MDIFEGIVVQIVLYGCGHGLWGSIYEKEENEMK